MSLDLIDIDREQFIAHAVRFWGCLGKKNGAKLANAETRAANRIVKKWDQSNRAQELLLPLLSHSSESVRYSAAAVLLNRGASKKEISVLRELLTTSDSLIAPTIKLIFMRRGIPF